MSDVSAGIVPDKFVADFFFFFFANRHEGNL